MPYYSVGTCGNGGTYGAGGGGASSFRFKAYPAVLGGGYVFNPVYGHGGGGGETSWGNYTVTPGQRLTVIVGYGGGSLTMSKVEVVRNQGGCSVQTSFQFRAAEGAGANGAVRILWGPGRSFPSTKVSGATN
ncbi:hypothetical protein [Pararhodobacter sp.]|uniref:hypothetical protein n=1 Tax=Pararhodobacter sp. TaxID=2127056 RepID=UPI002AFEEAAF|nr:hypothetical protein [Pararhodobacter sp.]